MITRIALAGNPNSGKTTLFNQITGMTQNVGNWTGVTIEKKEGRYLKNKSINIIDLPGIYSLTSYSLEEKISRNYILNERPDVIINVIDATNLERNLYLTTQLMECGIKMILVLNMEDELKRNGVIIDTDKLSQLFKVPVVSISALRNSNIDKLMEIAQNAASIPSDNKIFTENIEECLVKITDVFSLASASSRFVSVKLFERDPVFINEHIHNDKEKLDSILSSIEADLEEATVEIVSDLRYKYIESIIKSIQSKTISKSQRVTDAIDKIVTNKYLAFPIFAAVIFLMYYVSVTWLGDITIGFMEETVIGNFGNIVTGWLEVASAPEWLISLIVEGIITGVGMVLTFIPQILILFLFISILEGVGYMARVAFIMDRLFKKIGLSGKSFIPLIIGSGCSVPAIMSTRTIENNDERRLTIMLTPFVPCAAKLPVFALFAGAFFPGNPFAAPSMYLLGILMVIVSGFLLKKLRLFMTASDTFILELPQYRIPKVTNVLLQLWEKGKSFIIKAGTIIFTASIVLWFLQAFGIDMKLSDSEDSILAYIGRGIAPIFSPLGFGNWQSSVSVFSGFFAKEAVVSTLSILTGLGELEEISPDFATQLQVLFTPLSAYSFMAFILLSSPCLAAIGAMKRELGGFKWMFIALGFQTIAAYIVALMIFQLGTLFYLNRGIFMTVIICVLIVSISVITIAYYKKRKNKYCIMGCPGCVSGKNCNIGK